MPRSTLTDRARSLRARQTRAEARLWGVLRDRRLGGWKWRRQVPVGPFIVDFLCLERGLVVEVDGATHDKLAYDARRTAWLERQGLRVIRLWNHALYEDLAACCDAVLDACGGEAPGLVGAGSRARNLPRRPRSARLSRLRGLERRIAKSLAIRIAGPRGPARSRR
jgi:very-short-patch-repair endonuclease